MFPILQSPDRLKPVQDVAHTAPQSHGFSLTSEAGLDFKVLFSLRSRRGLGSLQQLPVASGSNPVRCSTQIHTQKSLGLRATAQHLHFSTQQFLRFSRLLSNHPPLELCPNVLVISVTSVPGQHRCKTEGQGFPLGQPFGLQMRALRPMEER